MAATASPNTGRTVDTRQKMVLLADCIRSQSRLRDEHSDMFAGPEWETVPGPTHNLIVEPNDDVCTTLYVSLGLLNMHHCRARLDL